MTRPQDDQPTVLVALRGGIEERHRCESVTAATILAGWMLELDDGDPRAVRSATGDELMDGAALRERYRHLKAGGVFGTP